MPERGTGSPAIAADVLVESDGWAEEAALQRLVDRALSAALLRARPRLVPDSEVSVVFTDDARVRLLNGQYRGKDSPTNVLSFPAPQASGGAFGPLVGDIVLAEETIAREAEAESVAFDAHLTHLIVHGFLHLLGYDHVDEQDAAVMERLETAILADLGISDPHGETRPGHG